MSMGKILDATSAFSDEVELSELEERIFNIVQSEGEAWSSAMVAKLAGCSTPVAYSILTSLHERDLVGLDLCGDYRRNFLLIPSKPKMWARVLTVQSPLRYPHGAPNSTQNHIYEICGILVEALSRGFIPTISEGKGLQIRKLYGESLSPEDKKYIQQHSHTISEALSLKGLSSCGLLARCVRSRGYDKHRAEQMMERYNAHLSRITAYRGCSSKEANREEEIIALACTFVESV